MEIITEIHNHYMELLGAFLTGVVGPILYLLIDRYKRQHQDKKRDKVRESIANTNLINDELEEIREDFKSDRVSVTSFPYSIVYKLYEPLPDNYEKFDECIVVKEMADPLEEKIKIIDFVNAEEPKLVLKTPDLNNVESPVQRRETQFKTEADILTSDTTVSSALRNEFLSQSLDSVEINTDYSKYENFVNFGSAEVRIRNFKTKLEKEYGAVNISLEDGTCTPIEQKSE